jgi:hypothetical protein
VDHGSSQEVNTGDPPGLSGRTIVTILVVRIINRIALLKRILKVITETVRLWITSKSWHVRCVHNKQIRKGGIMNKTRLAIALALMIAIGTASCSPPLSRPVTQREQTAGIGALAGGAGGAIIGSFVGSAVTGGLFGLPIGALAGYYIGDRMSQDNRVAQARIDDRDSEISRLRAENERLRRQLER